MSTLQEVSLMLHKIMRRIDAAITNLTYVRWDFLCHGWYDNATITDEHIHELVLLRDYAEKLLPNRFLPSLEVKSGRATHHWSGWPGAYCMLCGIEDPVEIQLADDPYGTDEIGHYWTCPPCPYVPYGVDPYKVQPL